MPDQRGQGEGKTPETPPLRERKAARAAARKEELASVAPVLITMPWRNIRAGYARVRDIGDFIRFYEMYAPLLDEAREMLIEARDSGHYSCFDLRATAGGIVVTAIDRQGYPKVLFEIRKDYWEGGRPLGPPPITPL